ncbi:terminase large subunit [Singulisphaera sp. PoT]|uniref:terminase large subunit n=1 Tax=Singulisphaera sp. PoT TaxID=3411797 RepID=UPI003BF4641C
MAVDSKWIRGPVDQLAIEQGCYFDQEAADKACNFIETFCRLSKGPGAGDDPLTLVPWQRDFVSRLFGWKRKDGRRRYRTAYVEIAKKNGKSALVSALVIYLMVADGERGPEVYLNAYDKEQALVVFREAAAMIRADEDLSELFDILETDKKILYREINGLLRANSADVPSKDGVDASAVIFDELHRQRDRKLWDIYKYAGASRLQPLRICITTAGEDESGVWYEQREYSEDINAGKVPDTSHLGIVYRALDTDDIDDPATWRKANPSMGVTLFEDVFAAELIAAKRNPLDLAEFKRLRLNIITRAAAKFVDPEHWKACGGLIIVARSAKDPFWLGLDLSTVNDLTCAVSLYGDPDEGFDVQLDCWLPEDNIAELEQQHGFSYRVWAQEGFIELTPGNVIDYGFIRKRINQRAKEGNLQKILVDPYSATKLSVELLDHDGLPVEYIRQGFYSLSSPTKELDRLIRSGRFRHGDNPLFAWMASNAIAVKDAAGNVKLSKEKSRKKIDAMAAAVNAIAGATAGAAEGSGPTVYEERGILIL